MSQPQNITFDVPNAFELEKLSELHKAMGDFTRMKILWQLMQGEQCVNDLATPDYKISPFPQSKKTGILFPAG